MWPEWRSDRAETAISECTGSYSLIGLPYCKQMVHTDSLTHSFIQAAVCLTTGPQPIPKPVLHTVLSSASFSQFTIPSPFLKVIQQLLTPSSSSSLSFIIPSITCFRRQFLRQLWPIQLSFLLFTVCTIFLSFLTVYNNSSFPQTICPTDLLHMRLM
jgi:hypothetical protein